MFALHILTRFDLLGAVTAPRKTNILRVLQKGTLASVSLLDLFAIQTFVQIAGKRAAAHVPLPSITLSNSSIEPKNSFVSIVSPVFVALSASARAGVYGCFGWESNAKMKKVAKPAGKPVAGSKSPLFQGFRSGTSHIGREDEA